MKYSDPKTISLFRKIFSSKKEIFASVINSYLEFVGENPIKAQVPEFFIIFLKSFKIENYPEEAAKFSVYNSDKNSKELENTAINNNKKRKERFNIFMATFFHFN